MNLDGFFKQEEDDGNEGKNEEDFKKITILVPVDYDMDNIRDEISVALEKFNGVKIS